MFKNPNTHFASISAISRAVLVVILGKTVIKT